MKALLLLVLPLFLFGQESPEDIINKAIKAHGGKNYDKKSFQFDFRDRTYTYFNKKGEFSYTRTSKTDEFPYLDILSNDGLIRMKEGVSVNLNEVQKSKYAESLNSVIYFAMIPHFLNDPAVNKRYIGKAEIKGTEYHKVEITFDQEGGGTDHDDRYVYWIDATDYSMDYLGYSYHVNGGGVRFRQAYNPREIDGVTFQDYVNLKADKNTPVDSLDELFISGELKELSRIELKNIRSL